MSSHYAVEYDRLEVFVNEHGLRSPISSSDSYYVNTGSGLTVAGTRINLLGVRRPDPYRMQVGCGDFGIEDFDALLIESYETTLTTPVSLQTPMTHPW